MLAGVRPQIDVRHGAREDRENRGFDPRGIADKSEDRSVMRWIGRMVEEPHAGDRTDRVGDPRDDLGAPPFADVRNALDERHELCER